MLCTKAGLKKIWCNGYHFGFQILKLVSTSDVGIIFVRYNYTENESDRFKEDRSIFKVGTRDEDFVKTTK